MATTDDQLIAQILDHFDELQPAFMERAKTIEQEIRSLLERCNLRVSFCSSRCKTRTSLERKLRRKAASGKPYRSLDRITDLVGLRIVTYYKEDADRVAKLIRDSLPCDWGNSEDKRDRLSAEQFGYRSDHYVYGLADDAASPLASFRGEVQIRTILQHAWAEIEHDELGYHSASMVPMAIRRKLARTAAIIEGLDEEFSAIKRLSASMTMLPRIRVEGLAEILPEFELALDGKQIRTLQKNPNAPTDLTLYFNVGLTTDGGQEEEAILIVEDSVKTSRLRGDVVGANWVVFRGAFPKVVDDELKFVRCRVRGIRVRPNMLGLSTESPTLVKVAVVPDQHSRDEMALCSANLATVEVGIKAALSIDARQEHSDWIALTLRCTEGFPGAFRNEFEETLDERSSRNATRIMLRFIGVPSGKDIWVSTTNHNDPRSLSSEYGRAQIISTDTNGAGNQELTDTPPPFEAAQPLSRAQGDGNYRYAVWTLTDKSGITPEPRQFRFWIVIPREGWPEEAMQYVVELAPVSTMQHIYRNFHIPRFAASNHLRRIRLQTPGYEQ